MKKSELKALIKECIQEVRITEKKNLEAVEGSFANWLKANLKTLEPMTHDETKLITYLGTEMKKLKVSDDYKSKFMATLKRQKTPTKRLTYLYDVFLKGAGEGVVK